MPTISQLTLYPIKSCAGIRLAEAEVTETGLRSGGVADREWMLVDTDGRFLTQRDHPRMALIRPTIHTDYLRIAAPGMPVLTIPLKHNADAADCTVTVWKHTGLAHASTAEVDFWFSSFLGLTCRLVRFHQQQRRAVSTTYTSGIQAHTLFSDGYPFLLTSTASLDDLNQKLSARGRTALNINRFRANIIIDGVDAFEEDYAEAITAGEICIKPVKPCARCPIPSINQETAEIGPDPLDILQTYRVNEKVGGGITFGMNSILFSGAGQTLRVGMPCEVSLAF